MSSKKAAYHGRIDSSTVASTIVVSLARLPIKKLPALYRLGNQPDPGAPCTDVETAMLSAASALTAALTGNGSRVTLSYPKPFTIRVQVHCGSLTGAKAQIRQLFREVGINLHEVVVPPFNPRKYF